ncbi:MAG: hypothetical protein N0C84_00920 [Candidatus Thiodiazotropha taylori]|uniref:Uncharacterized protein n=1 Tax=Candidatus Thiodiazotropha taylori TaxID=2792791 RepID=A0A9E4N1L0_9GAMM|nr:hypothetical protein [Candidatus Thiodiazotropha taylori]MCW4255007.1 hypothetical protein [Candidatus Thiodiazotropha taylori]
MIENPFYSFSDYTKNVDRINELEQQITSLRNELDTSFEDSTDGYDKIKLLQDQKRVKKIHENKKSRQQIDREAVIEKLIEQYKQEISWLRYNNDHEFGDKATRGVVEANDDQYKHDNAKILETEKNQYTEILDQFDDATFDKTKNVNYINSTYEQQESPTYSVTNSYIQNSVEQYSTGINEVANDLITETINLNGISVRYLPRGSNYRDEVWMEEAESFFHKGFMVDMMLISADGFEGEGHTMTQYGLEYKEEIELTVSMDRFRALDSDYEVTLTDSERVMFTRPEPLEGDLIIIPFGRGANNRDNYIPKVFQINYINTYQDGVFFQLGDLYQHRIRATLYELSAESINFYPVISRLDTVIHDSEAGLIVDGNTASADSDIASTLGEISDKYAKNYELEKRSQKQELFNSQGKKVGDAKVLVDDYTSKAFGLNSDILSDLDDI